MAAPAAGGVLNASWVAPTTNTDGSPLTDLASYRVYYGAATACPGGTFVQLASPTTSPGPNEVVSARLIGLTTGAVYYVAITAVNMSGDESACSVGASAIAQVNFSVSPTGTVSFGDVSVGSFADQVVTVQNTRGGTVSGSASASAPFSIVSGSPFTLVGTGAAQAVTVRFTPTISAATVTSTANFTADGDTISRLVTGTGVGVTTPTISVTITSPTRNPTYSTGESSIQLGGVASDTTGVSRVTWANNRGGSGTASGTTSWTTGWIGLQLGSNVIAVTAQSVAGNVATTTLNVTLLVEFTFTDSPIVAGMPVKAIHLTELRDAIDFIRLSYGLTAFAWTDPVLISGITPINAVHLAELRTALNDAYLAVGRTPPTYTDPSVVAGQIIKAVHLHDLRGGVRAFQ